jgi:hypothetical protein
LRLDVLDVGFDFSDLKLGYLVVGAAMVFVDESRCLLHSVAGSEPTRGFRDEETSNEYQGWRNDLQSEC